MKKKEQQRVWKKQYDNNVLVGTSRQGPALTNAPQIAQSTYRESIWDSK